MSPATLSGSSLLARNDIYVMAECGNGSRQPPRVEIGKPEASPMRPRRAQRARHHACQPKAHLWGGGIWIAQIVARWATNLAPGPVPIKSASANTGTQHVNQVGLDVTMEALAEARRGRRLDLDKLHRVVARLRVAWVMRPYRKVQASEPS